MAKIATRNKPKKNEGPRELFHVVSVKTGQSIYKGNGVTHDEAKRLSDGLIAETTIKPAVEAAE
jgi:hypothetical protein